jgi:hypothetical protein
MISSARGSARKHMKNVYWSPFKTDFEVGEEKPVLTKKYKPKDPTKDLENPLGKSIEQKIGLTLKV